MILFPMTYVIMVFQIEGRIELSGCGKDYLSTYANHALPFTAWLKGVESRISGMTTLPRQRDLLFLEKDEMKVSIPDEPRLLFHLTYLFVYHGRHFLMRSKCMEKP